MPSPASRFFPRAGSGPDRRAYFFGAFTVSSFSACFSSSSSLSSATRTSTPGRGAPTRLSSLSFAGSSGLLSAIPISVIPYRSSGITPVGQRRCGCGALTSRHRFATAALNAAEPETARRSDFAHARLHDSAEMSLSFARPLSILFLWSHAWTMRWYIVGTPMKIVMGGSVAGSDSNRDQSAVGEKASWNSHVAPATAAHSHALTMPWTWCKGRQW